VFKLLDVTRFATEAAEAVVSAMLLLPLSFFVTESVNMVPSLSTLLFLLDVSMDPAATSLLNTCPAVDFLS
jgi:hypothetical protein